MEDTVLVVARFLLAGVFVVSAVAKLLDRQGSREAITAFRAPERLVGPAVVGLPLSELLIAALLLPDSTATLGAAGAALLLLAFTFGIVSAIRRGEAPACHCFGALSAEPIDRMTIARNVALLAVAVLVIAGGGGPAISDWTSEEGGDGVALAATSTLLGLVSVAYLGLWRRIRRERIRAAMPPDILEPLPNGAPAPAFTVKDLHGNPVASSELIGTSSSVLVFVSTSCGPCHELMPTLARWQRMLDGRLGLHVISAGSLADNRGFAKTHEATLLVDEQAVALDAFRSRGTPSAVEIDDEGRVVSIPHPGSASIEALIRAALKRA